MPADLQAAAALCLSHYIAGSDDKLVRSIAFRNQATGVTYGRIEGTRYSIGE